MATPRRTLETSPTLPPDPEPLPVPNALPIAPALFCSVREPGARVPDATQTAPDPGQPPHDLSETI